MGQNQSLAKLSEEKSQFDVDASLKNSSRLNIGVEESNDYHVGGENLMRRGDRTSVFTKTGPFDYGDESSSPIFKIDRSQVAN